MKYKNAYQVIKAFEMAIESKCQNLIRSLLSDTSYTYYFSAQTQMSERLFSLQSQALDLL